MRYRVGELEIDVSTRVVEGPDGQVHVEPQVFDVTAYLLEHRDRAVSKTELMESIWGHRFISESALTSRIKSARSVLGDNGRDQRVIRTLHGFGYQFVGGVEALARTPIAGEAERVSSLPRFPNTLRGRDVEVAEVAELVGRHPVVTLVGTGGTGKTRLAVEAVAAPETPDRSPVFVDLAASRDPSAVAVTIAAALGIETGDRSDVIAAVAEYLTAVPHTVVLDNCEHVLAAASAAVGQILAAGEHSHILATSREPLGVPGERVYRLGPLSAVNPDDAEADVGALERSPATAVFLDRARLADDSLHLDAMAARRVAELCRALDGLPLAIELAAGRVSAFGIEDLVGLLDRRLDILGDRSNTRERRHRTLRATVEWSYDLLDEPEQQLFRSLSVLPGGVSLDAADWLVARLELDVDGPAALGRLVDASLLIRTSGPGGSRYIQLETLRAFGLDQLDARGETARVREVAARYVLAALERIHDGMNSDDEARWMYQLQSEMPNVRFARSHFADGDAIDELLRVSMLLARWARLRDATEVWSWSDDLVRRLADDDPRIATALSMQAQAAWRRGDIAAARRIATRAIAEAPDDWTRRQGSWELGSALLLSGDVDDAARAWLAEVDDHAPDGLPLGAAAVARAYAGDLDSARQLLARADNPTVTPLTTAAWLDYCCGEVDNVAGVANIAALERAIDAARALDAPFIVGVAMVTLASHYQAAGDTQRAAERYSELIGHWLRAGSWTQLWTTLRHVAELIADSHPATALTILEAAAADRASTAALDEEAADRTAQLIDRLERAVAGPVEPPSRLGVAEQARVALADVVR